MITDKEVEQLKSAIERLSVLLEAPEQGSIMWSSMLANRVRNLQQTLCDMGATPEALGVTKEK